MTPKSSINESNAPAEEEVFLRKPVVCKKLGIGESTLYDWIAKGRFRRPIKLSPRLAVWPGSWVAEFQKEQVEEAEKARTAVIENKAKRP